MEGGIGITELTVIALILAVIALPLLLRRYYPDRLWVGALLCLPSPLGQLYMKGSALYIIGLILLDMAARHFAMSAVYAVWLLSPAVFVYRYKRAHPSS